MSFRTRLDYWAAFRARVAIAALRGNESAESIARRFGATVAEVQAWRSVLERDAAIAFSIADSDTANVTGTRKVGRDPSNLDDLVESLAEHDRRIALLDKERDELATQVFKLHAATAERDARIATLTAELVALRHSLGEILESRSWKMTRLFRLGSDSLEALPGSALGAPAPAPLPETSMPSKPAPSEAASDHSELGSAQADAQAAGVPFDPVFYVDAYPDVCGFPGGPFRHYLAHGRAEGRMAMLPPLALAPGREDATPAEAVLVVSHEASRSGAPILSLELVARLRKRYAVVALLMGPGTIADDFRREADLVVGPLPRIQSEALVSLVISRLAGAFAFRFAIVNSIGSRLVLPELARRFVPTVTLVHEYASYTRPRSAFAHALFWSSESVFSAKVVRENALATLPEPWPREIPVLHQGRCALGHEPPDEQATNPEADLVRRALRPDGWPADAMVVIGVGQVHIRKGVDLFVACATRVLGELNDRPCRFVWIGGGFDPEVDVAFSNYLEDQIERSGLGDRFVLLPETSRIDVAYAAADMLLVTSRLDPLPNVGIDAMFAGLPLACFDGSTGLAEVLREQGMADECVVPYLDVESMGRRVMEWIDDPGRRHDVASRLAAIAPRAFDMSAYAAEVEWLALSAEPAARQERRDYATIVESGRFDPEFVAGNDPVKDLPAVARGYVRAWAVGAFRRKPFPGFHPGVYAASPACTEKNADPLAAFLRAGEPPGPWLTEVIRADSTTAPLGGRAEALLHVWLAKPGAAHSLARGLRANDSRPRLLVSATSYAIEEEARTELGTLAPRIVVRRARKAEAAMDGLLEAIAGGGVPAIVGQLTLDGDCDPQAACLAGADECFAVEHLLGGSAALADAVLERFESDPGLGVVWPEDPRVLDGREAGPEAVGLAQQLGVQPPDGPLHDFPSVGAFWIRSGLLAAHAESLTRAVSEAIARDRALRGLLPAIVAKSGLRVAVTHVPRCPR